MKFDTPNNACLSLRILAEMTRAGDMFVKETRDTVDPNVMTIRVEMPPHRMAL